MSRWQVKWIVMGRNLYGPIWQEFDNPHDAWEFYNGMEKAYSLSRNQLDLHHIAIKREERRDGVIMNYEDA
jgi:hypothetical protein